MSLKVGNFVQCPTEKWISKVLNIEIVRKTEKFRVGPPHVKISLENGKTYVFDHTVKAADIKKHLKLYKRQVFRLVSKGRFAEIDSYFTALQLKRTSKVLCKYGKFQKSKVTQVQ